MTSQDPSPSSRSKDSAPPGDRSRSPEAAHPILVGLSLVSDHDEHLLMFAQDLSRRLKLPLKLVHACEKTRPEPQSWINRLVFKYLPHDAKQSFVKDAHQTLCEIARRLSLKTCSGREGNRKNTCVSEKLAPEVRCEGPVAHALASSAAETEAALILIGAPEPVFWFNWGAANVRRLILEAPCPLLILRRDLSIDPSREGLRILLADDPTSTTDKALEAAFQLAARFEGVSLIHAFIAPPEATDEAMKDFHGLLQTRGERFLPLLESHQGLYKTLVCRGDPIEELVKVTTSQEIDILVAGCPRPGERSKEVESKRQKRGLLPPNRLLVVPCVLLAVPAGTNPPRFH